MGKYNWKIIKREGITFFFKYEPDAPDLLHIYVRHLTTISQALYVWFNGVTVRNEKYNRFETSTDECCLYWDWKNQDKKEVMIITCFGRI